MKILYTLFLLLIFSVSVSGGDVPKKKRILFVGDSVTAVKDYRTGKRITATYPNIVISKTAGKFSIDVLAKGGMTTQWMLKNLEQQLKSNRYDRIYLYGGINDAWNTSISPAKTLKTVEAIIDLAKSAGSEIYIVQGYETAGFMDYRKMPVTRYQKGKTDNLPLIEEYAQFQNELVKLRDRRRDFTLIPKINLGTKTLDGIHPNMEGQRIIADQILKTLQ